MALSFSCHNLRQLRLILIQSPIAHYAISKGVLFNRLNMIKNNQRELCLWHCKLSTYEGIYTTTKTRYTRVPRNGTLLTSNSLLISSDSNLSSLLKSPSKLFPSLQIFPPSCLFSTNIDDGSQLVFQEDAGTINLSPEKRINKNNSAKEIYKYKHEINTLICFHSTCSQETRTIVSQTFIVHDKFITKDEEDCLVNCVEPHLKRLRYEYDHWDDAIHGFRETEIARWNKASSDILYRMRKHVFPKGSVHLPLTHVLDLAKEGVIKPHIDSVRFCGNIISGLSLLSDAIMRLTHEHNKDQVIDVLLPRQSLYIMRDESRYNYTHEVLGEKDAIFRSTPIPRDRRISIISRNHPKSEDSLN